MNTARTSGDVSYLFDYWECPKGDKGEEMTFTLQVEICFIVPYSQIIKRNNQIIKINDQISLQIRPRLVQAMRAMVVNTVMVGMGDGIIIFSFDLVKLCG